MSPQKATVMKSYIDRNEKWLGNGEFLSLDINVFDADEERDCKGQRDEDGNILLTITQDFTKCGMSISAKKEIDEDGIEKVVAYKVIPYPACNLDSILLYSNTVMPTLFNNGSISSLYLNLYLNNYIICLVS